MYSPRIRVPLSKPIIEDDDIAAVVDTLRTGWLTHGPKNEEFEQRFADMLGVPYAISLNSCTAALFLALVGLGIKGEVILPSFTFVACANAIITAGAVPVFADIEPDSCNVSPASIEACISPRTEAIMPVHFAGQPAAMSSIMAIARRHGLAVIEDSAETLGATWDGNQAGSFGHGCFSFFPTKNMTTGEGGMLTTSDENLANNARILRAHGVRRGDSAVPPWLRSAAVPGYNFRLSNILAALGLVQLDKLEAMNDSRRVAAHGLAITLADVPGIELPVTQPEATHAWQMFTIKLAPSIPRDTFVGILRNNGIDASVHFDPPIHQQPVGAPYINRNIDLLVTEDVSKRIVTLPIYPGMGGDEIEAITSAVAEAIHTVQRA